LFHQGEWDVFDRPGEIRIVAPHGSSGYATLTRPTGLLESDRLTLISRQQIRREEAQGLVTTLSYDMSSTRRPIGLTTRRDWRPTATQIRFLGLLRESARRCSEIE